MCNIVSYFNWSGLNCKKKKAQVVISEVMTKTLSILPVNSMLKITAEIQIKTCYLRCARKLFERTQLRYSYVFVGKHSTSFVRKKQTALTV